MGINSPSPVEGEARSAAAAKGARAAYNLPETATEAELEQARSAAAAKDTRAAYNLPETATEAELEQARSAAAAKGALKS